MLDIIADACVLENVFPFLALADVGRLEAVQRLARQTVLCSNSWKDVACCEAPSFRLDFAHTVDKRDIKALVSVLRRTAVADRSPIALSSFERAGDIVNIVRKFQRQASAHLLAGGSVANVFVGHFRFPNNRVSGNGTFRLTDQLLNLQHVASALRFSTPLTTSCQLPSGTLPCEIKLVQQNDGMFLNAKLGNGSIYNNFGAGAPVALPQLLVDVHAISDPILLQMRNVSVKPDGAAVEKGSGLWAPRASRRAADQALADGLLCVLLVREDMHGASGGGRTVDALNLESPH